MTKPSRLERAISEATQAFANLLGAFVEEMESAKATVAPHQHPPVPVRTIIDVQPTAIDNAIIHRSISIHGRLIGVWTAERLAVLERDYQAGVDIGVIFERLNALPAPMSVKRDSIAVTAAQYGWRRPPKQSGTLVVPKAAGGGVWTPERLTILLRDYTAGVDLDVILAAVNALPGDRLVMRDEIARKASRYGWRRPQNSRATAAFTAAPAVPVVGGDVPLPVSVEPPVPQKRDVADFPGDAPFADQPPPSVSKQSLPQPVIAKAPHPAPPAEIELEKWTEQRIATAKPMYEDTPTIGMIVAAINALPGPKITGTQVNLYAAAHGWKRGKAPPLSRATPVSASFTEIRHWAGERGISVPGRTLPIEQINAKRAHLGMPPFVLTPAIGGRAI